MNDHEPNFEAFLKQKNQNRVEREGCFIGNFELGFVLDHDNSSLDYHGVESIKVINDEDCC